MINDKWIIRWRGYLSDSYSYGSIIKWNEDKSVYYQNELIPPGSVIHSWFSKTNYQASRIEPTLPLIDGESAYKLSLNARYLAEQRAGLILRIVFFDRYDEEFDNFIIRGDEGYFKPPIKTFHYKIDMINGGCSEFIFENLILQEVSNEEYDTDREYTKKNKKYRKKDKKTRSKSK